MRFQNTQVSCGANAVVNYLHLVQDAPQVPTEQDIMAMAGTDWGGTSGDGIRATLKSLGYKVEILRNHADPVLRYLPFIACADGPKASEHWIVCQYLPAVRRWMIADGAASHPNALVSTVTDEVFRARTVYRDRGYYLVPR